MLYQRASSSYDPIAAPSRRVGFQEIALTLLAAGITISALDWTVANLYAFVVGKKKVLEEQLAKAMNDLDHLEREIKRLQEQIQALEDAEQNLDSE